MSAEKEYHSSDTLERSNLSSLQSDNTPNTKKFSETDSLDLNKIQNHFCQQHTYGNMKFIPCPIVNTNFDHQCHCRPFKSNGYWPRQSSNENKPTVWKCLNGKWSRKTFKNKKDKYSKTRSRVSSNSRKVLGGKLKENNLGSSKRTMNPKIETNLTDAKIKNPLPETLNTKKKLTEKIEIYYFDHGNSAYYHTTDLPPILHSEQYAEDSSSAVRRCWAEIFGIVHIGASFVTTFILQFLRCILFSFVRPLTIGVIQLIADYLTKPLLSMTFNGVIQPIFILLYNMATSLRDCCEPLAATLGFYMKEFAMVFRACRLIEISNNHRSNTNT